MQNRVTEPSASDRKIRIPRILIAAPKSGSGKTLVTVGLLALLKRRGLSITSFKCGPDYIDPMFHRAVLGIPSGNLDSYFTSESETRERLLIASEHSDMAVMEGVMGYYDGLGGTELQASSYDLSHITETPVILVMDGRGMSRSVVPLVQGMMQYRKDARIKGVILNRVSASAFPLMRRCLEEIPGLHVLGYVPPMPQLKWGSRHLGLISPEEISDFRRDVELLADQLEESLSLPALLAIGNGAAPLGKKSVPDAGKRTGEKPRIAVARDEAFSFYYEENLALLRRCGAELLFFSPLRDSALPEADGLLLGGGYPELFAGALSENRSMRRAILSAVSGKMPVLAECGGFLYLQEELRDANGVPHPMVGALPGKVHLEERMQRFGYLELRRKEGGAEDYLQPGERIRGHEFHYCESTHNGEDCVAVKPVSGRSWTCMVCRQNLMAGFPHLYYPSNPKFAQRFVDRCSAYRASRLRREQAT